MRLAYSSSLPSAFFTVAKVLYVLGDLHLINAICEHCEPLRKSGKDLHLTNIRNEHAYFCFIHQARLFSSSFSDFSDFSFL